MIGFDVIRRWAVVILALCGANVAAGCSSIAAFDPGEPLEDPALRQRLIDRVKTLYPPRFRTVHRAVVTVHSKDVPLTGIIAVEQPDRLRMIGRHDFGGTVFDLLSTPRTPAAVLSAVDPFPAQALLEGALADARLICIPVATDSANLRSFADGSIGLIILVSNDRMIGYRFDRSAETMTEIHEIVGRRVNAVVQLSEYRSLGESDHATPTRFSIQRVAPDYRAAVEVIEFNPGPIPARIFEPPHAGQ